MSKLMIVHWNKLRGLAASGRVANLPSVASNVFLGLALAAIRFDHLADRFFLTSAFILISSAVCLYLAGNFLNDRADLEWDKIHRTERALPMGWFPAGLYALFAVFFALAGVGLAARVNPVCAFVSGVILCFIGVYTYWHKRSAWSVIPMGICRALLPVLGFCANHENRGFVWPVAAGLFCYIVGLSLSARNGESGQGMLVLLLSGSAGVFSVWSIDDLSLPMHLAFIGLLPYGVWLILSLTILNSSVSCRVSNLLAGIPLVDWIVLLPVGIGMVWADSQDVSLTVACLIFPPLAFLGGKALQRFASAS